ncbi:MAG: hypothetical protein AMJ45_01710 [Syntrophobacter sp. DG_60]|nr:MAG: hypothetical protein AMJ45_01710 [Syntrophobacter sp. DG_60]
MPILSKIPLKRLFTPISPSSLFARKRSLMGIDLGSHTVKFLELSDENSELINFGTTVLPEGADLEDIKKDDLIIPAIKKLIEQLNIKKTEVAVCLSSHHVIVKKIEIPAMGKEELNDIIAVEAEQHIPYNLQEVNLDYQILRKTSEDKMEILIAGAKKEVVERYIALFSEAGLKPHVIDVETAALVNAYETFYPEEASVVALIDIGASKINIVVLENAIPIFNTEIPSGGNYLTRQIQHKLNMNYTQAESLKIDGPSDETLTQPLQDIFTSIINEWLTKIKKTLEFFEANQLMKIDKLILSGGSSRIKNLVELCSERIQKPVDIFNPFRKLKYSVEKFDPAYLEYYMSQMPIALGLASRKTGEKK